MYGHDVRKVVDLILAKRVHSYILYYIIISQYHNRFYYNNSKAQNGTQSPNTNVPLCMRQIFLIKFMPLQVEIIQHFMMFCALHNCHFTLFKEK